MKYFLLLLCLVWFGAPHFAWAHTSGKSPALATAEPERTAVKVHIERDGNRTRFLVQNDERCEITMTFEIAAVNLRAAGITFPHTATFPAGQTTEAFVLEPENPSEAWDYSYTNYFKVGSSVARHDDAVTYELPYLAGRSYKVTASVVLVYTASGAFDGAYLGASSLADSVTIGEIGRAVAAAAAHVPAQFAGGTTLGVAWARAGVKVPGLTVTRQPRPARGAADPAPGPIVSDPASDE